jgi:hypothetical protein
MGLTGINTRDQWLVRITSYPHSLIFQTLQLSSWTCFLLGGDWVRLRSRIIKYIRLEIRGQLRAMLSIARKVVFEIDHLAISHCLVHCIISSD